MTRAGLLAGAGRRCRQTAASGGPASAAATTTPASDQPSAEEASRDSAAKASPAPASAAGTDTAAAPRSISAATCRSEPPRARTTVSSPARRTATIRAATPITAAAVTIRLTKSSSSTVSIAAWVFRNVARKEVSGEDTVTVEAAALRSPIAGVATENRLSALCMAATWLALTAPVSSGNSHWTPRSGAANAAWKGSTSPGSAMAAPTQNDGLSAGCSARVSPPCCRRSRRRSRDHGSAGSR